MSKLARLVLIALVVALVGVGIFLATWDIPAPTAPVEKVIPNDRLRP